MAVDPSDPFDVRLTALLAGRGQFTRRQAVGVGVDDDELRRWLRAGVLRRVRRGVYVGGEAWRSASPEGKHLMSARAALTCTAGDTYLTGASALLAWGVELFDADLETVRVVRTSGTGRYEAGVRHSDGELPPEHRREVASLRVASPAWALVDYARHASVEQAVVAMDSALHHGIVTREEIEAVAERCRGWSGSRTVSQAVRLSDGRAESVGESRTRYVLTLVGFAPDALQLEVRTDRGTYRSDVAWVDHRVVGEFDGRIKYGDAMSDGHPSEVAWRERQREQAIERAGWIVVRFTWSDLYDPELVRRRLVQAFARAERLAAAGLGA